MKRLVIVLGLVAHACAGSACHRPDLVVLETNDLDQLPALIRVVNPYGGYGTDDVLLATVPIQPGRVHVSRSGVSILAVKHPGQDWYAPDPDRAAELESIFFRYLSETEVARMNISLPRELSPRIEVARAPHKMIWFRVGLKGIFFNLEVAFGTSPVTIRKVSYRLDDENNGVVIENGATLKVR